MEIYSPGETATGPAQCMSCLIVPGLRSIILIARDDRIAVLIGQHGSG
jgi:hypothetical protein